MNSRFINWYTQALGATLGIIACVYAYLNGFIAVYGNIDAYFDSLKFGGIISSYLLLPLCVITLLLAFFKSLSSNKTTFNPYIENINIGVTISTVIIGFMGAKIYFAIPALFILLSLFSYLKKTNESNEVEIIEEELVVEEGLIENIEIKEENTEAEINIDKNKHNDKKQRIIKRESIKTSDKNEDEDKEDKESFNEISKEAYVDEKTTIFVKNENKINPNDKTNENNGKNELNEILLKQLNTKTEMAKELLIKNAQKQFITEITGLTLSELDFLEKELKLKK